MTLALDLAPPFVPLPEVFRFADTNPVSGVAYTASPGGQLPPWALRQLAVDPIAWDALVRAQATTLVVDPYRRFSLAWLRELVRLRPTVAPPPDVCPDCWGTLVQVDSDASLTGIPDALVLCVCATPGWWSA